MSCAAPVNLPIRGISRRIRTGYFSRCSKLGCHTRQSSSTALQSAATPHEQGLRRNHSCHGRDGTATIPKLRRFVPLCRFSSSIYNVPMLLVFRLFYQAAPFEMNLLASGIESSTRTVHLQIRDARSSQHQSERAANAFLGTYAKISTSELCAAVKEVSGLHEVKIKKVTWVKALASPLSHEYIQFIVEHGYSGRRHRLVVERSDWGDLVTVGWDWCSGEYASHHHILPLPLLTLSFEACSSPPSMCDFAHILSETSSTQGYRLLREMCWWFAEKVFVRTAQEFHGGIVTQWPHASLRYSFVVRTEWIKRPELARAAEEFRKQNTEELRY